MRSYEILWVSGACSFREKHQRSYVESDWIMCQMLDAQPAKQVWASASFQTAMMGLFNFLWQPELRISQHEDNGCQLYSPTPLSLVSQAAHQPCWALVDVQRLHCHFGLCDGDFIICCLAGKRDRLTMSMMLDRIPWLDCKNDSVSMVLIGRQGWAIEPEAIQSYRSVTVERNKEKFWKRWKMRTISRLFHHIWSFSSHISPLFQPFHCLCCQMLRNGSHSLQFIESTQWHRQTLVPNPSGNLESSGITSGITSDYAPGPYHAVSVIKALPSKRSCQPQSRFWTFVGEKWWSKDSTCWNPSTFPK